MRSELRTLSGRESKVVLGLEAQGREVLSLDDISSLAEVSPAHARKLAERLAAKGWIQRVGRGKYLLNPPKAGPDAIPDTNAYRIGSRLVTPYYFGYATAATYHGLLSQASRTYFVVTTSPHAPKISEPAEFRIVRVPPRKFFGITEAEKSGASILVADVEKTVVDAVDRPDYVGGISSVAQIISNAKPRLDAAKLVEYTTRMRSKSLAQRLGYLLDHVPPHGFQPRARAALLRLRGDAFVSLASPKQYPRRGRYVSEWRVVLNVPESDLMGEVNIG
ncbi:MAG: type IV toxin-antitoxin system AbiEi family antitoxin [Candidatus Thermoplasmatota archaeon]